MYSLAVLTLSARLLLGPTVSYETWMTPAPSHTRGLLVYYGPQWLIEANASFRGYDLSPYRDHCGLSAMSPADMGKVAWVRVSPYQNWYGPCLVIDEAGRNDFYTYVYEYHEVAEVSERVRNKFGFTSSMHGELWIGLCPPRTGSYGEVYAPRLVIDSSYHRSPFPYPIQEYPAECHVRPNLERAE